MSRTGSSIKNFIYAIIGQSLGLLISFISRIFFIKILGSEYLGLNGLFTNILTVLSLAELGVGNAIIYSLYKPIANNDTEKCKTLMNLYKKFYIIVGIVIFAVGAMITPFLSVFIKDMPDIEEINLIYILFVANTAVSYFFSYKRNLIIANQNRYIATIYRYAFYILLNIVQIIYLIFTKDYIGYLVLQVLFTLLENVFVSRSADKMYPYLKEKEIQKLDKETKKEIVTNIKALMLHKIGNVVVNSTDNIILSTYVGLIAVGLYSNYYLITYALNVVLGQIFTSLTASVGNLCASETTERQYTVFKNINFLTYWLYSFSAICLIVLFNPFIEIWLGTEYLFTMDVVLILVVNFYISGMRKSVLTFREAKGLFYYDRYKPILESIINLVTSIILAKKFGVFGVFLGTAISSLTTCVWVEPYVLFKHGFNKRLSLYFKEYLKETLLTILMVCAIYFACTFIKGNIYIVFVIKLLICLIVPNAIMIVLFHKTEEFKYFYEKIFISAINKIRKIMRKEQ